MLRSRFHKWRHNKDFFVTLDTAFNETARFAQQLISGSFVNIQIRDGFWYEAASKPLRGPG